MTGYSPRVWTLILCFYLVGTEFVKWCKDGLKNNNLISIVNSHDINNRQYVQSTKETTIRYTSEQLHGINRYTINNKLVRQLDYNTVLTIRKLGLNIKRKRGAKGGKNKFKCIGKHQVGINWNNITKIECVKQPRNIPKCNENLKLAMANVCSIKNKHFGIRHLLDEQNIDLMLLSETWLRNKDKEWVDCCELNKHGYSIECKNREDDNSNGGGLALVHKDSAVIKHCIRKIESI